MRRSRKRTTDSSETSAYQEIVESRCDVGCTRRRGTNGRQQRQLGSVPFQGVTADFSGGAETSACDQRVEVLCGQQAKCLQTCQIYSQRLGVNFAVRV